jgi:hypothetical protein
MAKGWLTRSYNFISKDPEIDKFRTLWQAERIRESDLAVLAGLSVTTVKNMFGGETRRPAHTTFAKMAGAMGYEYALARETIAREEYKEHRKALAKKRDKQKPKKRGSNDKGS